VLATAAPAAASASNGSQLSGSLEFLGACSIAAQGTVNNAHITAFWTDGIIINVSGGDPGTPVPTINLVATFTDASNSPVDMIGELQHPSELSFVAPSAVGFVAPSISYVFQVTPAPAFDATGAFGALMTGTLRIGNNFWAPVASLPHGGFFHLALVVGGQVLYVKDQVT
jgi:hypothetical protein